MFNKNITNIPISPTLSISAKTRNMISQGHKIINMSAGESHLNTPLDAKISAIRAIIRNKTRYTSVDGIKELKKSIIDHWHDAYNIQYSLDETIVGSGAKSLIYMALCALLEEGNEVIIMSPYWVSYPSMVTMLGGKVVVIKTCQENNFCPSYQDISRNITNKTKAIIINSPHNPTGYMWQDKNNKDILRILEENKNIYVISDEIYKDITYDHAHIPLVSYNIHKERIITICGVSKSHAMTGWRIGYAMGNTKYISFMKKIASQITSNPSSISQYAALGAIKKCQKFISQQKICMKKNRDYITSFFNDTMSGEFNTIKCQGAFYAYVDCTKIIQRTHLKNDVEVTESLLESAHTSVVPGVAFGFSPYIRLSYAITYHDLKKGLNNIYSWYKKIHNT